MLKRMTTKAAEATGRGIHPFNPLNKKHAGKVVIVTASTDGIGFSNAQRMAQEGASVVVCSRKEHNVESAVKRLHSEGLKDVLGVKCHVSKDEDRQNLIEQTLKTFGGIDCLIHCAGISPNPGQVLDCTSESFDKIIDVNLKSAFEMTKLVWPHMKARKAGSIIYLSSIVSFEATPIQLGMYGVSKLALNGLTKSVAKQLVTDNIRVNCIAAGLIDTKYADVILTADKFRSLAEEHILMKRLGQPGEIAGVASFLASEDASYITGEVIPVSGGVASRV